VCLHKISSHIIYSAPTGFFAKSHKTAQHIKLHSISSKKLSTICTSFHYVQVTHDSFISGEQVRECSLDWIEKRASLFATSHSPFLAGWHPQTMRYWMISFCRALVCFPPMILWLSSIHVVLLRCCLQSSLDITLVNDTQPTTKRCFSVSLATHLHQIYLHLVTVVPLHLAYWWVLHWGSSFTFQCQTKSHSCLFSNVSWRIMWYHSWVFWICRNHC